MLSKLYLSNYFRNLTELKALIPLYIVYKYIYELTIVISQSLLQFIFFFLKYHINYQYKILSSISGIDLMGQEYRFCISYDLLSYLFNNRLRVKTLININMLTNSIINIYENANWWEREIWDMFGIFFENHFDMRRILTDYGYEGHPLKKDFPLCGFIEVRYNEYKKKVIVEPVVLTQKYRNFTFEMPW